MEYQLFVILAPVAAIVLLITAARIFPFRGVLMSRTILAYLIAVSALLAANTLELVVDTPEWTLFFARLVHPAWHAVAITWFLFAAFYSGRNTWARASRIAGLAFYPVLFSAAIHIESVSHLFWTSLQFFKVDGYLTMSGRYGWLFWINGVYAYSLILIGVITIVRNALDRPDWYKRQTLVLVAGAVLPVLANLIYIFRLFPWPQKDYTSIAFALSGLAFYLGVQNVSLRGKRPLTRSTVLQDVHSAVLVLDNEGTILDANPAAMEMLNLSVQGGLYHHSSLSRGVVSDLSLSSHHNTVKSHDWDNGEQRTFDITVRPVAETTGVHSAAVVTIHETTEWLRLKQANQDIHLRMIEQERLATIGMLSASIAHEIKNPLTVLRSTYGSVYDIARRLLAEQTDLSESPLHEELKESDEAFRRGFERIGSVLQTMTGHARPFENESLVNVDLHQIITDTLQLTRSVYRGVATVEQRFGTIPTVFCMPGAISQVFLNILLNAVQAIESKGHDGDFSRYGKIVIETAVGGSADEKKMVQCRILNNGPEIPSEVAAKIFEPFFTTKSADVGSGLGLSISRRIIVDRHNGRLEVIQRDGMTGFLIGLPIVEPEP